jgi:hypothetical protein
MRVEVQRTLLQQVNEDEAENAEEKEGNHHE